MKTTLCVAIALALALTGPALTGGRPLFAAQDQPAAGGGQAADKDEEYDEYEDEAPVTVADPLEPFNREMFTLNDTLYFLVLKPAARTWRAVLPVELRTSASNFFRNLRFPVRFVNSLLQAKWLKARNEFAQFFLNSTVGFLGIADVGSHYPGLKTSPEDTGQSFALWGAGEGFYLTLPLMGPSTGRDALGRAGDILLSPLFWLITRTDVSIGMYVGEVVNETSFRIGDYEAIKKAALDPYVAIRNGYIQNRNKLIGE